MCGTSSDSRGFSLDAPLRRLSWTGRPMLLAYRSSRCGRDCATTIPSEAHTRTNWQMAQICQRVETWRLKRRLSSHSGGVGVGCAAAAARPSSAACATASTRPALVTSSTYSPQKKPPSGKSSTASQSASLQHAQAAKLKKGCGAAASRSSVARGSSSRPHHKASSSPASAAAFLTAASTSLPFFSFSVLRLAAVVPQPSAPRSHTRRNQPSHGSPWPKSSGLFSMAPSRQPRPRYV